MATQEALSLNDYCFYSCVSQFKGCRHSSHSAPYDKCPFHNRDAMGRDGLGCANIGKPRVDYCRGLCRCCIRIIIMDPAALFSDVSHVEMARINSGFFDGVIE